MRVRVLKSLNASGKCDINVIPFGIIGEINFKKQIKGEALELVNLGKLSLKTGGVLLVGAVSDNYGVRRRSVFIFERGRLTAVSDMNFFEQGFSPATGYKIVQSVGGKIGVLVDKDAFSPSAVFSLCSCGCSAIIDLYADFSLRKARVAAEFYAYCHGVNFAVITQNEICAFDSFGEKILTRSDEKCAQIIFPAQKACSDVRIKTRGALNH